MPNRTVVVRLGVDVASAVLSLRKVAAEAKGTAGGIKRDFGSTSKDIDKTGASTGKLGGAFKKVGLAGAAGFAVVGAGAIGLGIGLGKAVQKAATFESSMRQVGKQTGLSGDALKNMTDLALEMGAKTSFSAQGASDAMLELAKGGMSAADQKAGALQQTLTLASAGGLELGDAASYMTQGLNTFGLAAKDSGRVAAALAGAANASTASVQDMGIALSQVGPSAAQLGLSIEDTTAALAAFTNNGMKGSDAGTSLKTMLTRLQPTTLETSYLFKELGLETKEAGNRFFDAEGNLKSMSEVAGILQEALKGQTREQKAATLSTLFGADAQRAATILAKEGKKGIAEYAKATSDSAAAQELAASATEGFSGAMERFQGAMETAQIQLGTKFLPILTRVLDYLSGPGITTFQGIATILRDTFAPQIDKATGGIERFFDYLSTHQADVIRVFQSWGNGIFDFGVAVAKMASGGLRSLGDFAVKGTDAVLSMVEFIIRAFHDIPFVDMSESIESFKNTRTEAERMAKGVQKDLYGVASKIDKDVIPSVEKMRDRFNKSANEQIVTAEQRDAVARIDQAIKGLSKSVEGSTRTTKDNSTTLDKNTERGRVNRAAVEKAIKATNDKIRADFLANVESKGLTKATDIASGALKSNKKRLEDAATAAGFSKREVRKMIDQYKLTPDELKTKVSTPGMKDAREDARDLGKRIKEIPSTKKVTITFSAKTFVGADGVRYKVNTSAPSSVGRGGPTVMSVGGAPLSLDEHGVPQPATKMGTGHGHREGGPDVKRSVIVNTARVPRTARNQPGEVRDMITGYEQGIGNALGKKMAAYVGTGGSPGGAVAGQKVGPGWAPIYSAMRKHGAQAFNTYPGHHPSMERARDVYPHSWAAANAARALSSVWYVIYRMKIASKNHGNGWRPYKPTNFRGDWQHVRHIHVARYDQGGALKPGLTLARNDTGKPEHVVTDARWQQLMNSRSRPAQIDSADMARFVDALSRQGGVQLTINNPVAEPASRSIAKASLYASR